MREDRSTARRHRAAYLAAAVAVVVVLVLLPPAVPNFGPSLTTPLTTSTLTDPALLLAWIVLALLAVVLLQRAVAPRRALTPPPWATRRGPVPGRPRPVLRREPSSAPRLLVAPRARQAQRTDDGAKSEPAAHEHRDDAGAGLPRVRVLLLGPPTLEGVRRPRRAATIELLAYLALHPPGARADELVEAMWPDQDPDRTRPRLWQSASEARRLLGEAFMRDGDRYALDRDWATVDIDELDRLLAHLEKPGNSPGDTSAAVGRAFALWRAAPLAGTDYAWAESHVRRLEAGVATLAERGARIRLAAGDPRGALDAAERGLAVDSLNEAIVRIALEAEAALGQRERLTDRYETFRQRLDADLGLEPERETRLLYRRLLSSADD
jgi:DNA-binding SARP family transcriptional activator